LGHWLPAPAGPALAVVALVGLGLARPWADLAGLPVLDLVMAVGAWPLLRRHPVPPVFAATACLALRVLPLAPLAAVLLVGGVAAVVALLRKTAPIGQAMGAVVLGAVVFWPFAGMPDLLGHRESVVLLVLVFALAVSTGWRPSAPLAVTAAFAAYAVTALVARLTTADGAVAAALVVAATALTVAARFVSWGRFADR
ncbi:MAG: hypothetical protein WBA97_00120, partial [Actinophytocola sp.]|uniref:hypothetical protein n=1 Tax=Actinophytocola sp. TaxID=1872138 RepID=UPI003C758F9B